MFLRIFCLSTYVRLVSVILLSLSILLSAGNDDFKEAILEQFNQLEECSIKARKAFIEGCCLLDSIVKEINAKYGYSLTLIDAGRLVKTNLLQLQLPSEVQNSLLTLIEFIEIVDTRAKTPKRLNSNTSCFIQPIHVPLIWKWFRSDKMSSSSEYRTSVLAIDLSFPEQSIEDPPAGLIFGAVEIFAGALLCIIPHPLAWGIGGGLITDGISRVLDNLPSNDDANVDETDLRSDYNRLLSKLNI